MSDVQHQEDGQRDVRGEEVRHVELARPKDLEAVGDGQERHDDKHNVCRVWLEWRAVWEGVQQAVVLERGAEAQVCDHDDDPGDEARDCADVDEPVEHRGARVGHVEVCQQREHPCEEHRDVRDTVLVGAVENLGRLARQGHRVQHTRPGV